MKYETLPRKQEKPSKNYIARVAEGSSTSWWIAALLLLLLFVIVVKKYNRFKKESRNV